MAVHAVYALAGFGEYELFNALVTGPTSEAGSMIGILASHDCFVVDFQLAHVADI